MKFPTINFKFNDLHEAQSLTEILEQKCVALQKYLRDNDDVGCDVEFKKILPQQNGQIYQVEINLKVNGNLFRAVATEESFEKAIDVVRDDLDRELRTAKEKQETRNKQAGREMKERMVMVE